MIVYDPGRYGIVYAISLHGSVFPRATLPGIIAGCVAMALHYVLRLDGNGQFVKDYAPGEDSTNVLGAYSFILGFLIVFRSQQAYSRWWEGGTLLQQLRGEWFNSFSCLIAFCNAAAEKKADVHEFQHQLVRLFSLLYGCALQQVASMEKKDFELISMEGLEENSLTYLQGSHDRCEITLQWIQRLIVQSDQEQLIKIAPPILSRVFNELGNGIVNLNNARKITDFPIPFHLAQMITIMLIGHTMLTIFTCAASVHTLSWSGGIAFLVVFSYWSVYYISLEMEMPFGDDLNDLPLQEMQRDMNKSLTALLDPEAQHPPEFNYISARDEPLRKEIVDFDSTLVPSRLRRSLIGRGVGVAMPGKCATSAALAPAAAAPEDATKSPLVDVIVDEAAGSECSAGPGRGGIPEAAALNIFVEAALDLENFRLDLGEEEGQPEAPKEGFGGRHAACFGNAIDTTALASRAPLVGDGALASRALPPVDCEAPTGVGMEFIAADSAALTDICPVSRIGGRENTGSSLPCGMQADLVNGLPSNHIYHSKSEDARRQLQSSKRDEACR